VTEFTSALDAFGALPPLPDEGGVSEDEFGAPNFADPVPLDLDDDEIKKISETIKNLYRGAIEDREEWKKRHEDYDLMFRGALDFRGPDDGPWPNSSNLHVQMPYWLIDSYATRLTSGLLGQVPLVVGHFVEDDDAEVAQNAADLVKWHFEPKRMNLRDRWHRMSKIRCIHGRAVGTVHWARDEFSYRTRMPYEMDENGVPKRDEDGNLIESDDPVKTSVRTTQVKYDGPILVPHEWEDVIEPFEGTNLQPVTEANPQGADWVGIRSWESLGLIWKKRGGSYAYIKDDEERADWVEEAPSQDRSGGAISSSNQSPAKLRDRVEGRNRNRSNADRSTRTRQNPEFEIITWFMPWEIDGEDVECVFFWCVEPERLLGAFPLSDIQWHNRRPLIEIDFQTLGNRRLSMGIPEIVGDLSAELDTIHNMRMDVGFATNMPFFFYSASSTINPERIVLRPGKGIPVDDVRDVQFPQMQNVTSFYHQEEQLLYSLVERVLGVTDLFLGVSPTKGAAARHATGFVGTQQEAMARTEEIMSGDAIAFSNLCHLVYEAEIQYGPDERILRLQGREGPLTQRLSRDELWFRGEYDIALGANHGLYSSMLRQQQAQMLTQQINVSPLINQDPGRRWEAENFIMHAYGFDDPERFIGPKEAVSAGTPKDATEENGEMDQFVHGVGVPAPVHPSDNDAEHLQAHIQHVSSEAYLALGRPNLAAFMAHIQATQAQMMRKQQQQEVAMMNAMAGGGAPQQSNPQPNANNVAQLDNAQSGAMGDVSASPQAQAAQGVPSQNGRPPMINSMGG
jgi:hypothetical protein